MERGKKMGKNNKDRIAFEVLMILLALTLFCFITRLWPLLFLVIPGILIAAVRMLFLSTKRNKEDQAPVVIQPEPARPDTEQDVIRIAFGILQRRITEQITSRYPAARWVWESPNAIERFAEDMTLVILLNRAGGFRRAMVSVHNLQFCGIVYETAETGSSGDIAPDIETDGSYDSTDIPEADAPVDYALIAFQWVEANLLALNNRCNDIISEGLTTMLISADELPHRDSWADVCDELMRNGFSTAVVQEDGIEVALPE